MPGCADQDWGSAPISCLMGGGADLQCRAGLVLLQSGARLGLPSLGQDCGSSRAGSTGAGPRAGGCVFSQGLPESRALVPALSMLLKDPAPVVRMKVAEALGRLVRVV
ncbi:hypothetical protein UY3_15631 [Chelonia mydas]|uniref:Uncharacterized protein n=1 Tax=Chelonia mydas TaxID=8469 RepID=M7APT6_CHEMY|nr:hypothetical protein UY3_15631 [Chelonia mydas]